MFHSDALSSSAGARRATGPGTPATIDEVVEVTHEK